jgi:hypothetical protein
VKRFPSIFVLIVAFLCNVVSPTIALAGGFPSRPKFSAVGIGVPASTSQALVIGADTASNSVVEIAGSSGLSLLGVVNTKAGSGSNIAFGVTNITDADLNVTISEVGAATKFAQISPSVAIPLRLGNTSGVTTTGNMTVSKSGANLSLDDTSGSGNAYVSFYDNSVARGHVGSNNAANTLCGGSAEGDICVRAEAGSVRFSKDAGTTSKPIPRMWVTACTSSGTQGASIDATCSRSSTGIYVATFSNGNPTACTISPTDNTNTGIAKTTGAPGSTVNITTVNTSGALADLGWTLTCWGV